MTDSDGDGDGVVDEVQGWSPIFGAVAGALLGALIVLVLVLLVRTWSLADRIRDAQKVNTAALQVIKDCTTPHRECYERSRAQTAGAVADINRITVYASACADRPGEQTQGEIQACVIQRLAAHQTHPK